MFNFFKKKEPVKKPNKISNHQLLFSNDLIAKTNVGNNRAKNEDFTAAGMNKFGDKILFVCDGLGGYCGGKEASTIVGETIIENFLETNFQKKDEKKIRSWFVKIINEARFKISELVFQNADFDKMATTLAFYLVVKNQVYAFNIGDSRLYAIKNNLVYQISKDQNFLNFLTEQEIEKQKIENYGHQIFAIINYIGAFDEFELKYDFFTFNQIQYDWLFVTSDGVHNFLSNDQILKNFWTHTNIVDIAEEILNTALINHSNDNLSIAIKKIK